MIIRRKQGFLKRRKKWIHFKLKWRKFMFRLSLLTNICLILYIYDPNLTNTVERLYGEVAPYVESLLTLLPL